MKNYNLFLTIPIILTLFSCANLGDKLVYYNENVKLPKVKTVLFFRPEVIPNIEELKDHTYSIFYDASSNKMKQISNYHYLQTKSYMPYDDINVELLKTFCKNNNAEVAIIPRIKYFKVGLGKYVFSNQVVVSLKLYDAAGNFLMETSYDTYTGNARLLGSAENSVIIGTNGAIKKMNKELRNKKFFVRNI